MKRPPDTLHVDGLTARQWAKVLKILRGPTGDELPAVRALMEQRAPDALAAFLKHSAPENSDADDAARLVRGPFNGEPLP